MNLKVQSTVMSLKSCSELSWILEVPDLGLFLGFFKGFTVLGIRIWTEVPSTILYIPQYPQMAELLTIKCDIHTHTHLHFVYIDVLENMMIIK